jgi:hypothetical protein
VNVLYKELNDKNNDTSIEYRAMPALGVKTYIDKIENNIKNNILKTNLKKIKNNLRRTKSNIKKLENNILD